MFLISIYHLDFGTSVAMGHNVLRLAVRAGFKALNFNNSTKDE